VPQSAALPDPDSTQPERSSGLLHHPEPHGYGPGRLITLRPILACHPAPTHMRALVWFRRDLRLDDNNALSAASRDAAAGVVGIFLLSPAQWLEHDDAPCKIEFWLRSLEVLRVELEKLNIPLLIRPAPRFSDAPGTLLEVAREVGAGALYLNREYEVNERRRDEACTRHFEKAGLPVRAFTDHVLLEPGEVRTQAGDFYSVFTPFRRRCAEILSERGLELAAPPTHQRRPRLPGSEDPLPSDPVLSSMEGFSPSGVQAALWPGGEREGHRRLREFLATRVDKYKEGRDFPARDVTSRLSPYLAAGVISPRRCMQAAIEANRGRVDGGEPGPEQWISELLWREFYQHILVGHPRVSMHRAFREETEAIEWSDDEGHFEAWCEGRTGYPLVDAAMRCLRTTGWMHNRLRMVAAMFLTKDLFLDWRRGERFFMRHLVDGDLGSNNGGWQWAASTGTDAAPYFRIFNPDSQSRRFDPEGRFIREHVPELAQIEGSPVHDPTSEAPLLAGGLGYPSRIVDHSEARERAIAAFKAIR
jgi:deoxyribodipyrimidine photo-lyase